jgi:ABC-type multidrug transport system fused ATPase/permease subunit
LFPVNYAVIGFALLYLLNQEDMSESRAASLLAEGSYACLYLISAFSTLLDMSQKVSKLCGYSARIVELLKYVPPTIDDVDIKYMKSQDDNKSDASASTDKTSSSGSPRPSFCGRWGTAFGSDVLCSCFAACSSTCDLSRTRALMQRIFHCIQRQQKLSSSGDAGLLGAPLSIGNIGSSGEYSSLSGDQPEEDGGIFDKTLAAYNSSHGRVAFNNMDVHDSMSSVPSSGDLCVAYFGPEEEEVAMQYRMLSGERTYCSIDRPPGFAASQPSNALILADPKEGEFMVEIKDLSVLLPLTARRGNFESAQATYAVSDLNLRIPTGMRLLVTGDSGCGKTTLLRVLCGLWSSKHGAGSNLNRGRVAFNCAKKEVMFLPQVSYYTEVKLHPND